MKLTRRTFLLGSAGAVAAAALPAPRYAIGGVLKQPLPLAYGRMTPAPTDWSADLWYHVGLHGQRLFINGVEHRA